MSNQVTREQNNWTAVTRSESNFERMYREQKKRLQLNKNCHFVRRRKLKLKCKRRIISHLTHFGRTFFTWLKAFGCKYGVLTTEWPGIVVQRLKETNRERMTRGRRKRFRSALWTFQQYQDQVSFSLNLCTSKYGASIETSRKDQCPWKQFSFSFLNVMFYCGSVFHYMINKLIMCVSMYGLWYID